MGTQRQNSGDDSLNLQANGNINISTGLTAADAYSIAKSLFIDNFPALSEAAHQIARDRAEEIVNEFISKFTETNSSLQVIADPDFQYSLLTAQRDYARSGDPNLKSTLVNLLVQRSNSHENLEKVVLAEAIEAVRKLTHRQISALTVAWFMKNTTPVGSYTLEGFLNHLKSNISPFTDSLPKNNSEYIHIQYSGCGSTIFGSALGEAVISQLPGLFQRGFTQSSVNEQVWPKLIESAVIAKSPRNPSLWEIRASNDEALKLILAPLGIDEHVQHVTSLFALRLDSNEVENIMMTKDPFWESLANAWHKTFLGQLNLSSVGMAIAHSNWSAKVKNPAPLSVWISEEAPTTE